MEKGWQCGFLARSTEYRAWNTWTVTRPTLIVIDHLASRAKEVRNAIASLSEAAHRFNAPLRILILERPFDPDDEWVDQFIPSASPLEAAEILASAYRPDGAACRSLADCTRSLGPLAEPDLIAIVDGILATEQNDRPPIAGPAAIIARLREADAELRPLFLILAMRALCNGSAQDLRQWDRQHLVEAVLRRDFLLWQDTLDIRRAPRLGAERKLFEGHLTVILAATITSRTDGHLLEELKEFGIETPARIQQDWVRVITGDPLAGNRREFALLKPDLVGECFVLERCTGSFGIDASRDLVRRQMTILLSASLAAAAAQTTDFLRKCISDFPQHEGLSLIASIVIPEGDQANIGHLQDYAVYFSQIANLLARGGREDIAEACWTTLISVIEGPPFAGDTQFEGTISEYLATARYNRGLSRLNLRNAREARDDLDACVQIAQGSQPKWPLGLGTSRAHLHLTALRLRAVADLEIGDLATARKTLDGIVEDPEAPPHEKAEALLVRAHLKGRVNELNSAIIDLDTILEMGAETLAQQDQARADLARLLLTRSIRASELGSTLEALVDLDRAEPLVTDEAPIWAVIRVNRCGLRAKMRQFQLAEEDCTAVIQSRHTAADQVLKAKMNRAQLRLQRRDWDGVDKDLQSALDATAGSARDHAGILLVRAQAKWNRGDQNGACMDLRAATLACAPGDELLEIAANLHEKYGCSRHGETFEKDLD